MLYLGTDYTAILTANPQKYKNPTIYSMVTLYRYQCKMVAGIPDGTLEEKTHDGLVFMEASHSANKVNGIYMKYDGMPMQILTQETYAELTDLFRLHPSNETVYDAGNISMIPFKKYQLGVEYLEVNAY